MATTVYSRTLQKAAEMMGGHQQLSRHLRVPAAELQRWIDDKAVPPIGIFLRVVDYIIAETPPPAGSSSGNEDPSAPRDCSPASGPEASSC